MKDQLKLVIVEDEEDAILLLSGLVKDYCPELALVGVAQNVKDAVDLILRENPKVVMIDVSLGNESCFDVLKNVDSNKFHLIFTTAYAQYAFDAFQYDAVYYLLKPYSISELRKAVIKILEKVQIESVRDESKKFIRVQGVDGAEGIKIEEISHILAARSYCTIQTSSGKTYIVSKSMKELMDEINSSRFVRIHNSCTVNITLIKHLKKKGNTEIVTMNSGDELPISRRKKDEVLSLIKLI